MVAKQIILYFNAIISKTKLPISIYLKDNCVDIDATAKIET